MVVLGSTGSIGVNTLCIAEKYGLEIEVLVAGRNIDLLNEQIARHRPRTVVIQCEEDLGRVAFEGARAGEAAILDAIEASESPLVVNAMVGFSGLRPTLAAIACGKRIALANKESLVAAGAFIDTSDIQPIDSEHFGLWYLLQEHKPLSRMVITASGGAFRDWPVERLASAGLEDALKHPNWSMGRKITIDSATMMNKLFELLEARWLFGEGEYDAVIETKSIIHALIDFKDGSSTAHLAHADMQLPIAYALMGRVDEPILKTVDLVALGTLEFREITRDRYAVWALKDELLARPERGVVVNAANEAAIERFMAGDIGFTGIADAVLGAYRRFETRPGSIDEVFEIDREVRDYVRRG